MSPFSASCCNARVYTGPLLLARTQVAARIDLTWGGLEFHRESLRALNVRGVGCTWWCSEGALPPRPAFGTRSTLQHRAKPTPVLPHVLCVLPPDRDEQHQEAVRGANDGADVEGVLGAFDRDAKRVTKEMRKVK